MVHPGQLDRNAAIVATLVCGLACSAGRTGADASPSTTAPPPLLRSTVAVEGVTSGSGVVIGREGLVLTAAHVAGREGRGCFVILEDGTRLLGISVAVNSRHDFAIVKVPGVAELCAAELADGNRVGEGSEVIAIGYSRGFRAGRPASVRRCRRTSRGSDMPQSAASIYSDAALVPGDSGGPLFDRGGRLVGIHVQALRTSDGAAAMHVSIEVIRPVLAELRRRANPLSVLSQSP